ncbi:MAG: hypothetical protein HQK91_08285 [Nitrospirae bacterium]|nr:hypothetical protein [Nitrospirota bacterium]
MKKFNVIFKDIIIKDRESIVNEWTSKAWDQCFSRGNSGMSCSSMPGCNTDIPLKHIFVAGLERIFDELIDGKLPDIKHPMLNDVIAILAIQDSAPSKALSFYTMLTSLIKNRFKKQLLEEEMNNQFIVFIENINNAMGVSFDIYMNIRERLFNLKIKEIMASNSRLLKMAKLITNET